MTQRADSPKVKHAKAVIAGGNRADVDRLREKYEGERNTSGITTRHQKDLDQALGHIDNHLWGDKPVLRALPREQHQQEKQAERRPLRHRVASATAIHARQAGSHARERGRAGANRAGRGAAGAGTQAWQQTGIPAAGESTSELLMKTLGGMAAISFVYLLLTPNGTRAISIGAGGINHALAALVSPNVDPLHPSSITKPTPVAAPVTPVIGPGSSLLAAPAPAAAGESAPPPPPPPTLAQTYPGVGAAITAVDQALTQFQARVGTGASKPRPAAAAAK